MEIPPTTLVYTNATILYRIAVTSAILLLDEKVGRKKRTARQDRKNLEKISKTSKND